MLNPIDHYSKLMERFTFPELAQSSPQHIAHMLWDFQRLYARDVHNKILASYWKKNYQQAAESLGHISVYAGCMKSGKSDAVLKRAVALLHHNTPFLCIKPALDTRDGAVIKSRTGEPTMQAAQVSKSSEITTLASNPSAGTYPTEGAISWQQQTTGRAPHIIIIDEAFMLDGGLLKVLGELSAQNVRFIISTLDNDHTGQPFPFRGSKKTTEDLRAMAHKWQSLYASCHVCQKAAMHTQLLSGGGSPGQIMIGDHHYAPVCLKHFKK